MSKEGAIILGIGGDSIIGAQGTFYEVFMTSGYPTDIAAAKYSTTSLTSGPALTVNSSISFQVTKPGYSDRYISHIGSAVNTKVVSSSSTKLFKQQASWNVRIGLANSVYYSYESNDTVSGLIPHYNFII